MENKKLLEKVRARRKELGSAYCAGVQLGIAVNELNAAKNEIDWVLSLLESKKDV